MTPPSGSLGIRLWWCCLVMILSALPINASANDSPTDVYAIVIGNNAAPVAAPHLSRLKYADDDAVRFYRFFKSFGKHISLLTLSDDVTQKRYGKLATQGEPPTMANLLASVDRLSKDIQASREKGHPTALYFVFSGHGAYNQAGEAYLSLVDGQITQMLLYNTLLSQLNADFQHVFIDACYAGGVAMPRGMFASESDATHVNLQTSSGASFSNDSLIQQFPGLGIIVSATGENRTHEWSVLQSGIFTHEILSGLSGAADVNLDGDIEYSELDAFISAANSRVDDERARLTVVSRPPQRDRRVPIVTLSAMKKMGVIQGNPQSLGRFFIERKNGERYLDANLGAMPHVRIVVPRDETLYLYAQSLEAEFTPGAAPIGLSSLTFHEPRVQHRGGIADALDKGLFQGIFGREYYLGFVSRGRLAAVPFDWTPALLTTPPNDTQLPLAPEPVVAITRSAITVSSDPATRWHRVRLPVAVSLYGVGGAALITSGIFGVLALKAKQDFDDTNLFNESLDLKHAYEDRRKACFISLGIGAAALITGLLIQPKKRQFSGMKRQQAAGLVLDF